MARSKAVSKGGIKDKQCGGYNTHLSFLS